VTRLGHEMRVTHGNNHTTRLVDKQITNMGRMIQCTTSFRTPTMFTSDLQPQPASTPIFHTDIRIHQHHSTYRTWLLYNVGLAQVWHRPGVTLRRSHLGDHNYPYRQTVQKSLRSQIRRVLPRNSYAPMETCRCGKTAARRPGLPRHPLRT